MGLSSILFFFPSSVLAAQTGACSFQCQNKQNNFIQTSCDVEADCVTVCQNSCPHYGSPCDVPSAHCVIPTQPPAQAAPAEAAKTYVGRYGLKDPLGGANIPQIVARMVSYLLGFVGALFLLFFVYGGILWMTAGSSERIKTAKKTLTYAVLGMIVVILSYTIITIIINLSGSVISGAP